MRRAQQATLAAIMITFAFPLLDAGAGSALASRRNQLPLGRCTMAVPLARATVEVEIANPADFCEIVSRALAGDVFREPVVVTPDLLWHYADARVSCQLGYRRSAYLMTIWNSTVACRWIERPATGWHPTNAGEDA